MDQRTEQDKIVAIGSLHGTRALLVEDNEINQELAQEILINGGMEVEIANNGREALEVLSRQTFDVVLMDCQMPVMDGYEATCQIRGRKDLQELPVIAMTANAMKADREKVLAAGMNDYIAKPLKPELMMMTIAKWVHRRDG